jgi:hypothetical protein
VSRFRGRGQQVPADVAARADLDGEKVLASAETTDGTWLFGTRDALVVVDPVETRRIVWEQVQHADWDRETDTLRVVEVAPYGERSPVHTLGLEEPGRLLQLVRERITASVVLSRRVPVTGRKGLTVIGRRPPRGTGEITGEITWGFDLDPGLDPDDPAVLEAGAAGLREARRDLGLE